MRIVVLWLLLATPSHAVQLENLDTTRPWRIRDVRISGNARLSEGDLKEAFLTLTRPWYRFWEQRPLFDPVTFREDLQRLNRLYESRGFYHAEIGHDLSTDDQQGLLTAEIRVSEGPPIVVADVDVQVTGNPNFPEILPIKSGDVFTEDAYQRSEQALKQFYSDQGYAHVESQRKAEVVLENNSALVDYIVTPGPPSVFGPTEVAGLSKVDPEIVLRERAYQEGETYSLKKLAQTRSRLVALDLFGTVNVAPQQTPGKPPVVPMLIEATEKEAREVRIGVGYGREDRFRTQVEWRHNNWLGDGRRLSLLAKYSFLEASGAVTFLQPHLFSPNARGVATLRHDRIDEETYLLNTTRFNPRLEYRFSERLSGYLGHRLEYNRFADIPPATVDALDGVQERGWLSGPALGLTWTTADNVLDPTRGEVISLGFDHSGQPWGGDYRFYRIIGEARKYWSIGWQTVLASRLRLGFADPLGATKNLPVSERFFAGGEKSVRGFGRRRLGPLSSADDPIGGLSLLEGSVELRRPIWQQLGGALFLDFGQVSTRRFHVPVSDLEFAAGFGISYHTPIGPLRVDIGFPFRPPPGDSAFQVHFSVGAYF